MLNQRVVQAVQVVYLADMHKKDGQRQVKTDLKTAWKSKCPKTCRDFQLPSSLNSPFMNEDSRNVADQRDRKT